jgi:hypothetical protein
MSRHIFHWTDLLLYKWSLINLIGSVSIYKMVINKSEGNVFDLLTYKHVTKYSTIFKI